jgi:two-component system sensor histidine kinase KdpD
LNDVVAQITGITARETVPDRLLDIAFEIKLIDIPPEDLIQRLHEGKIYIPDQAAKAIKKFFRPGNLLDNAHKYAPPGSIIEVSASAAGE